MKYLVAGLISLFIIFACKDVSESSESNNVDLNNSVYADSLTAQLDSIYKMGRINGLGVAIVDSSGILYAKGFGTADIKRQKAYTENTIQNIASISKTFIGIALLKAQEQNKLHLDDPINNYLPFEVFNPRFPSDTITIRHLAAHTSSIQDTDIYDEQSYVLKESLPDSLLTMVEENFNPPERLIPFLEFLPEVLTTEGAYYTEDAFIESRPGEKFEYSNIGATLAALVLEMATEVPFDQYTTQHILKPVGMNSSGWTFDSIDLQNHSNLYADIDKEIPLYELITYPDGGLRSSTHDMALYLVELIKGFSGQGTILAPASYKTLYTALLDDSHFDERNVDFPYNDEYNMGVFMGHSGTGLIGHTGGDPGINSFMFFDPLTGLGQYLIINTSITDEEGVNQLFGTMRALKEFGPKLTE